MRQIARPPTKSKPCVPIFEGQNIITGVCSSVAMVQESVISTMIDLKSSANTYIPYVAPTPIPTVLLIALQLLTLSLTLITPPLLLTPTRFSFKPRHLGSNEFPPTRHTILPSIVQRQLFVGKGGLIKCPLLE